MRTPEELLALVTELRTDLDAVEDRAAEIRAARLEVFREIKRDHPSLSNSKIGAAAGMSDVGVINILRRADESAKKAAKKEAGGGA